MTAIPNEKKMELTEYVNLAVNGAQNVAKYTTLICNNAAWSACLDAYDKIRQHPRLRCSIKGGGTINGEFRRAFKLFDAYERRLKNSPFFNMNIMVQKDRERYGNISNGDYYDFWSSRGFTVYNDTKPFFTSLVNKLRLAYEAHGEKEPLIVAWSESAAMALGMAKIEHEKNLDDVFRNFPRMKRSYYAKVFEPFSLSDVGKQWQRACGYIQTADFEFSETEESNIRLGVNQLVDKWLSCHSVFDSISKNAKDFSEIFRDKEEIKRTVREVKAAKEMIKKFNK